MKVACLLVILTLCGVNAQAQPISNFFLLDKNLSGVMGAQDLNSIHEILFRYEQAQIPEQLFDEDSKGTKILGGVYRASKLIFVEFIQDAFLNVAQHEVFGHGARLREFGDQDVRYQLHLVSPYDGRRSYTFFGAFNTYLTLDQLTSLDVAGVEGEVLLANELRMRALERGSMNYRESNLYLFGRIALLNYATQTTLEDLRSPNGNDIAAYINLVRARNQSVTLSRIKSNAFLNLLDPFTIGWIYSIGRYLRETEVETSIPMIRLGSWKYLPGFRFGLTPFGYEYALETLLKDSSRVLDITTAAGSADNGTSEGLAVRSRNLAAVGPFTLDAKFNFWHQPSLQLTSQSSPASTSAALWSLGGLLMAEASVKLSSSFALTIDAGYKSKGFVEGEMLDFGPIFRAGLLLK